MNHHGAFKADAKLRKIYLNSVIYASRTQLF